MKNNNPFQRIYEQKDDNGFTEIMEAMEIKDDNDMTIYGCLIKISLIQQEPKTTIALSSYYIPRTCLIKDNDGNNKIVHNLFY